MHTMHVLRKTTNGTTQNYKLHYTELQIILHTQNYASLATDYRGTYIALYNLWSCNVQ